MTGASWAAARTARESKENETRALLLACAARVFARQGYARTSIADITADADVSRPTFYLYFTSKAEVFEAVALRVRDEFLAAHEIPSVDEDDPYELGRASTSAALSAYATNFDLMTVIEHQAIADEQIRAIWEEIQERPRRRMVRYVERLTADGIAHPAAGATAISEAVVGMIARFARTMPADAAAFERRIDELTAMYLRLLGIETTG